MPQRYDQAGVKAATDIPAFGSLLDTLRTTFAYPSSGRPVADFGFYANVLDLGNNLGLAISTDGVGTKLLLAEQLGMYDTVGIDCIAMNVNDIVCVGARPLAMVDYVAVRRTGGDQLARLAEGLRRGADLAHISIPGGELAQVPELLGGGDDAFDLVGTAVGTVALDRAIWGDRIAPGDALLGFASAGLHSNGFTLARKVLLRDAELPLDEYVADFGRTLGEELLEPTRVYVDLAMALIDRCDVHALAHITGDGLLNLGRFAAEAGFEVEFLPEPQAVFALIRRLGSVPAAEMYRVFNMGVGFCAVVPERQVDAALAAGREIGIDGWRLGTALASPERAVTLRPLGLRGVKDGFRPT